ncbi:MAG: hypothetical protein KDA88_02555, partial [Planctomycetaceae bacterium]|nr:hypothetical protein [Planctomycetaceae bacterium]
DIAWSSGFFLLAAEPVIDGKPHPNWGVSTDIRFQPPAPNIKIGQVADVTQQPVVTIPLQIQCDVACRVGVSVSTKGNEEKPEIVHWDVVPGEHNLEAQINLAIGFNQIEVTAENQDPLLRFENVERSRLTFPLIRTELNRPALQANVQQVSLRSANSQAGLSREQLRAQPVVDEALWNLAVKVESSQEIKCSYQLNDQLLEMRHSDDFWIADLKLNPGANHIEILAFNGNEKKLLESIDVRFQPAVPNIGLLTVSRTALNDEYADQWLNGTIVDGIHESELQLACPLQTTVDGIYPYLAQMLVDGTPVPEVELQRNDQQLSARWVPPQGRHRVQFRVSNQWGSEQLTAAVSVERVSPPEISKLVAVNPTPEQAIVQTSFEVSPSASFPIEPGLFRASVNGELVPLSNRVKIDGNRVDLLVPGQPGTNNEVQIWMESDERVLVAPSSVNVDVPQLRGKLPEIDFDVVTETSHQRVPVGLRILSESQLARLEVGLALGKLQPILENEWVQRDGYIEVLAERNLMFLQPGVNTIFVVAENQSGTTTEQQIVTFVPKPVSLGSMYFASKPTQTIDFSREDRYLGSVDTSQQELDVILELDADSVGAKNRVQVWVNGFLQASAPLTSDRDGAAHRLKAFVTLTRPQGNTIELEFAQGIKSATNLRRSFTVDCLEPSVEQELFVVILDATSPEDDSKTRTTELQNRLQEAVLAYERKGRLISDTFQVINFEHVMYGEMLELRDIKGRLSALRLAISQRQETAKISPVVLMYYRGHEQVFPDDQGERQFGLYTAASSRIDDEQARVETLLTSREIRERFAEMGGAHLLVLDLDANDSKNNPWPVADPYLGVFRFVRDEEQSESVLSELQRELPEAQVLVRLKQQMQDSILKRRVGFPDFHVPRALEQLRLGLGSKNLTAE